MVVAAEHPEVGTKYLSEELEAGRVRHKASVAHILGVISKRSVLGDMETNCQPLSSRGEEWMMGVARS